MNREEASTDLYSRLGERLEQELQYSRIRTSPRTYPGAQGYEGLWAGKKHAFDVALAYHDGKPHLDFVFSPDANEHIRPRSGGRGINALAQSICAGFSAERPTVSIRKRTLLERLRR